MKIDFTGKTAIVTGGTRGIGKKISRMLLESGCEVIYTGTKQSEVLNKGNFEELDLNDDKSINNFVKRVIKKIPTIDILINNAGINIIEPIDEIKNENWNSVLKVNLTGSMQLMRETTAIMRKRKVAGRILNISSIFGVVSKEKRNAYSATKTGLIGITRSSALDLASDNILVNALCPGFTLTELTQTILSTNEIETLSSEVPLGRFADVEEIAKTALFLCSDLNSYMTGQILIIDGGFTAK